MSRMSSSSICERERESFLARKKKLKTMDAQNVMALRVMRLCRPSLQPTMPVSIISPSPASSLSLTLPRGFGQIHLGEVFSCYVTIQ